MQMSVAQTPHIVCKVAALIQFIFNSCTYRPSFTSQPPWILNTHIYYIHTHTHNVLLLAEPLLSLSSNRIQELFPLDFGLCLIFRLHFSSLNLFLLNHSYPLLLDHRNFQSFLSQFRIMEFFSLLSRILPPSPLVFPIFLCNQFPFVFPSHLKCQEAFQHPL